MHNRFHFNCYKSVAGGWVACGTIKGQEDSTFKTRTVWFGCQAEGWPDLQIKVRKLVTVLARNVFLNPRIMPIEMNITSWPAGEALVVAPGSRTDQLFRRLNSVGVSHPLWSETSGGVVLLNFMNLGGIATVTPEDGWKPEMESRLLSFVIEAIPEHPRPTERFEETKADLIEAVLSNAV